MSFARLSLGHWIAAVAALALLLTMAGDWYGTKFADSLRRDEGLAYTGGSKAGDAGRALKRDIPPVAEAQEQNAWQAFWTLGPDVLLLALLLASVALPLGAAYLHAAGIEYQPPLTPISLAAGVAAVTALGVAFRLVEQPGLDEITTVRGGALLGLVALGLIAFGAGRAAAAENSG